MLSLGSSITESRSVIYRAPEFHDFSVYLPWAARSLCLEVNVVVKKTILYQNSVLDSRLHGELDQTEEKEKNLGKSAMDTKKPPTKSTTAPPTMKTLAFKTSQLSSHTKMFEDNTIEECTVYIEALYNRDDTVVQLIFESVPKNKKSSAVLKLIGLVAPQLNNLHRLTFKTGLDAPMLHEMKHFLSVSTVTEVILDYNIVPEANFYALLEVTSLRYLSVAGCKLGDDVLKTITEQLKYPNSAWQSIMALNLSSNMITDIGASYLADALRSNIGLASLDLSSNQMTDKGAAFIFNVLTEFPLTSDEILKMRTERIEYVKQKMMCVSEKVKPSSRRGQSPSDRKKNKSFHSFRSSPKSPKSPEKDLKDTIGMFNHPYAKERAVTFVKNHFLYHYGNFSLKRLNLNYNTLTNWSVRKLLKVLLYQRMKSSKAPMGLMQVSLEGNFIFACQELDTIHFILSHKYFMHAQKTRKTISGRGHTTRITHR